MKRIKPFKKAICICIFSMSMISFQPQTVYSKPQLIIADNALSYVGKGEVGGDNKGVWVDFFIKGHNQEGKFLVGKRLPWCAAFVSYVLQESGYTGPYRWKARDFLMDGKKVSYPEPGNLAVFWRGNPNQNTGHVGIVTQVEEGWVYYVDGNNGPYPAKVTMRRMRLGKEQKLIAYIALRSV